MSQRWSRFNFEPHVQLRVDQRLEVRKSGTLDPPYQHTIFIPPRQGGEEFITHDDHTGAISKEMTVAKSGASHARVALVGARCHGVGGQLGQGVPVSWQVVAATGGSVVIQH